LLIIFGSDEGLILLCESKRWQGDGTFFNSFKSGFYQLYTLHGLNKWQMITCLWILLSGKSGTFYEKMLNEIKLGALKLGLELRPEIVIISLALIPIEKVEDIFDELCIDKPDYDEKIDHFLDYVLLNYIRNDENDR
jgi:hypothetical protein